MKKNLLLLFLSIAFFVKTEAQSHLRTYEINSDTTTQQFLDNNYWQVLEDKNSSFTINDVQKEPLANQFTYFTKNSKIPFTKTSWFRFNLKNNTGKTLHLSIISDAPKADFYIPDSNGIMHHFITGSEVSWHSKDGFKNANAIPFEINEGQQIMIYLKALNHKAFLSDTFKFPLLKTDALEKSIVSDYQDNYTQSSDLFSMFLSGIFLLAGIFILLIYFTVSEKVYLYFSLFAFFGSLSYLHPFYSVEHVSLSLSIIFRVISYLWAFFCFQFVRHYLKVSEYYPRWNRWIGLIMYSFLIVVIIGRILFTSVYHYDLLTNENFGFLAPIIDIIFWLSFLITILLFSLNHAKETRAFLLGVLPFSLVILCFTLLEIAFPFLSIARNILKNDTLFWGYANGIGGFWLTVVISWVLFKRFGQQEKQIAQEKLEKEQLAKEQEIQKSELIAQQKIELEKLVLERTSELKQSLEELKSTQAQLIQSEKMASLGELTSGIAHEIQNPLNFVNNFSDVNREMVDEAAEEIGNGNIEEVKNILNDIKENSAKINHHGKRADAIVKGMLQHSRQTSGTKEPTDINALCDEYLRLAYHGLQAKDKSFNAVMKTDFDENLPLINVIPQDIGRVLLNIINNAFYAVSERKKLSADSYQPLVSIKTRKLNDKIEIKITDNGNGIPDAIKEKIFQPFFTTKPTGQGTGLGLSLSYDIVKAHGGELNVETNEGEGSVFTIQLQG
ncbi:MAG: ATP-binding protein [Chitinophagaceae bacterium]|nr:GHKL domain-containing protein [Chitinophagaceae bacterium]